MRTKAREFKGCSMKQGMSAHFIDYLGGQQKEFTRCVECPSHFEKEPIELVALKHET